MNMREEPRHDPQGALRQPDGSVLWRVWAPLSPSVRLVTWHAASREETPMTPEDFGYFTCLRSGVEGGLRYTYRLADGGQYPDPASRWQPEGVHRPSAVFFPEDYSWSDSAWCGVPREDLVLYELHVGAFTPEGTFEAIVPRLPELAALGVTALELMPVAQLPGDRNWGYDGVHPNAVQNAYGGPRALQRLIDAAHGAGLAVILDVVYNHLGPEGNYLGRFGPYFTDRYRTPWGNAINFDGADSDAVRRFFIDNACMWVRDFHADGLRLDAVHANYDFSARHILADIQAAVQAEAARQNRIVHVIAESNQNDVRQVKSPEEGGYGLDGVWSDDFHHSVHALLTGERDGYYMDFGRPRDLAKAFQGVFVYDGCYSALRRRRHGSRVGALDRTHFVVCVQNHDQVGNRAKGDRLSAILAPEAVRLACGLLLLSPCVPLLFMGEEYGETAPFPFFCSFGDAGLAEAVRRGRREEFAALRFEWKAEIPDPQSPGTFAAAKLRWAWPEGSPHAQLRKLYEDLLAARRRWPALRDRRHTTARLVGMAPGEGDSPVFAARKLGQSPFDAAKTGLSPFEPPRSEPAAVLVLERGSEDGLVAVANLSPNATALPPRELAGRRLMLSTEDVRYGGSRAADQPLERLFPYELLILGRS
jgi:maltooligosyltrehalose trehalohydrolase